MTQRIRLGISTCPNDTFAFHGLLTRAVDWRGLDFEISLLDIERLNEGLLGGAFDVVVCDGFDGNIVLKGTEGAAILMMSLLKQGMMMSFRTKIGALLSKPAFKVLKKKLDYTEYGGAPLLGVNGGVIKAHGSSNGKAFRSAILQGVKLVSSNVTALLGAEIAQLTAEDAVRARDED